MHSKQTLTNQLRELETDGIIEQTIFSEIPPRLYNVKSQLLKTNQISISHRIIA
ncbi:helix-turn-helix domain-containing protein [Arcicella rosea]|uniref:winged helix-turn-helix transcriptional regulator n=1 Tax=Arcicella rosea TaxID=502909 RepID=UPI0016212C21|nr:winged helix-turn-helix transcriptional regulator [Arcicella rosea]